MSHDIHIRKECRAGRITLTRPDALNALTWDMAMAIEAALADWRDDDEVALVIIDAEGEKAFCAGGDIQELYEHGKAGDFDFGRKFWSDEYRLNAAIADYEKPYIALMQGFVMGGGVGIACHGSHRIVCETTQIAMPECGIGLIPDVGGSFLLARAPWKFGEYLGLTGTRMNAADAIHAGFADLYVPMADWPALKEKLCEEGRTSVIGDFARPTDPSALAELTAEVNRFFGGASALECVQALEADDSQWPQKTAKAMRRGCPLSVACAFELIAMSREIATVREALDFELRFTWRSQSHGEFVEGVRAQVIDKDRDPNWHTARLEDVTPQTIAAMLAPIRELA